MTRPAADELITARDLLRAEAAGIERAASLLDDGFSRALDLIQQCAERGGTVLVTGLGKSGLVGAKIAATMSSLGITAHSVHPTEAAHGDLGRFRPDDVALCLSHSGETEEVVALAAALRQDGLPVISITGGSPATALARVSDVHLADGVTAEAGQHVPGIGLAAPTASTTAAMALGDALALLVAARRSFTDEDFARRHPGGQLGGLLRPVADLLRFRAGENLPLVTPSQSVAEALEHAAGIERRPGAMLIIDESGALAGIFTDGDLRRLVRTDRAALDRPIADVMTRAPRTLPHTALARDAVNMIREHRQDEIPIVDSDRRPVGLLDVQDLVAMRLVRA